MTETLTLPGVPASRPEVTRAAGRSQGEGDLAVPAARVIGLDPSLTATGMSNGNTTWLLGSTKESDSPSLMDRGNRLRTLARAVLTRIPQDTHLVVIEGDAPNQTMGQKHDRAGLWWLIVSNLQSTGIHVVEITPSQLKKYATGNGNCNKALVVDQTARRYPNVETGANDNRCDALWLAAMGIDHLTGRAAVPAAQRATLAKVRWPS